MLRRSDTSSYFKLRVLKISLLPGKSTYEISGYKGNEINRMVGHMMPIRSGFYTLLHRH